MHGVDMDLQVMGRTKKQTHTGVILLPRASPLKKFFDASKLESQVRVTLSIKHVRLCD